MLAALGARLLDASGRSLPLGAAALAQAAAIDLSGLDPRLAATRIEVACDVDSPLTGPRGASVMFGAQKGASAEQIGLLDGLLEHFADVSARTLRRDHRAVPGAGAAGGLGFALLAFLGAELRPGVEIIAAVRGLDAALEHADLCLTGEGRIDAQTLHGKTVMGVTRLARSADVPVIAFAGSVDAAAEAALNAVGIVAAFPIANMPMTLDAAVRDAGTLLEVAASRVARLLRVLAVQQLSAPGARTE
jgi:glycerate kinase